MANQSFVHLHCHSHYSLLDGANRIPELVGRVKELGMNALALTDHGNLYGAIEFYAECRKAGVNPIVGYEAYVAPGARTERDQRGGEEKSFHLTLLAQNRIGFQNLIKMSTAAFLEGYYYRPRIDRELLAAHKEGLICLSGCASSEFSRALLKEQFDEARQLAEWFARTFGENFFVEIQDNGLEIQRRCKEGAIDIAQKLGLPLVATCDAHYLCQGDSDAHDVLLCINTGKSRGDQNRMRYGSNQFYVRPPGEMYQLFDGHADAVARSQEIANRCDIQLDFKARHFPAFTPPAQQTAEDYLRELCQAGMKERYGATPSPAAQERLEHELNIICRMGFASYFLIVWDFVRFAREQGIPASARGSACGAVVSYVLQLSQVDPLQYDLLFERFLDPNRSEAPDIDIDFCQERREEVIAYVRKKYGEQSVAQIGTFGTMAARAAVKDVGRALDVPLERVTQLTKMIPTTLGITLEEALKQNPDLKKEYDSDPLVHELIDIASKLEGTNRNAGTHAAGVVIANGPLTDYVPLQRVIRKGEDGGKSNEATVTTQWVMGDLEKIGLLKMDFLGLRTLTLLNNAVKIIAKTHGVPIDLDRLPLDDAKSYALLQRGQAKGVFQLESEGIRELLKRMKPDNIRDIIAIMALYRPGPLQGGMVDSYVNRKHGREKPDYPHPVMHEVLEETYGVMVYQEQIMRILNRLGGIELSSAYACIKAISKKKQDIIDQRQADFFKGAQQRGLDEATCREIWNRIIVFAGYGFNKSHTAAYAQIGYQTAYLKANYPAEFMAALLSSEIDDANKRDNMVEHIADARELGIEVVPPAINASDSDFTVQDGKIVFGLTAIKGVGRGAAAEIVRARQEKGPFKGLFDVCERIDLKLVPRLAIEKLIKAGACDGFGARRSQLMEVLTAALQSAADLQQDRRRGQGHLFGGTLTDVADAVRPAPLLPDIAEWSNVDKLKYEKEALDFYFSSHPLAQHEEDIKLATHRLDQLANLGPNQEVCIAGMFTQLRFQNTKKARNGNSRYVRCRLEDLSGSVECVMWPDDFLRHKDLFQEDRVCFVTGIVEHNREEPGLVLNQVLTIEQARARLVRRVWLQLIRGEHSENVLDRIAHLLRQARGDRPVFVCISDGAGKHVCLKADQEFNVNPASLNRQELTDLLGPGRVKYSR